VAGVVVAHEVAVYSVQVLGVPLEVAVTRLFEAVQHIVVIHMGEGVELG